MAIDWGLLLRIILFVFFIMSLVATIAGAFYVYRYKISANCKALKHLNDSVHKIREETLPYLVTYNKLSESCTKQTALCKEENRTADGRLQASIEKSEVTILARLDKMDDERTKSLIIQTKQREKRLVEFTQMKKDIGLLFDKVEAIEAGLS